ncbi:MAG: arginine--tRNA ligase [Planctomycetota bacterium]|jgi:arginyl-tRNA synthetase
MIPPIDILEDRITTAMAKVSGIDDCKAIVRPTSDPKFGDYQANGVMTLAKKIKTNPRKLAEQIVQKLDLDDICESPEVAGPGFINLRLKPAFLANSLIEINADTDRLAIDKTTDPKTIVVDFSGPNIAKQMHVGHLRSTIIGDCICRTLDFLGHNVIRQNHIGDWGTQFGTVILGLWHLCMAEKHGDPYYQRELAELKASCEDRERLDRLCCRIRDRHEQDWREDSEDEMGDGKKLFQPFLESLDKSTMSDWREQSMLAYQYVNLLEGSAVGMDLTIPSRQAGTQPYEALSRHVTTMLQARDEKKNDQEYRAWHLAVDVTLDHCDELYERLRVTLNRADVCGESFYADKLADLVHDLEKDGWAKESDGAICVFSEGFKNKEGEPLPMIVQKSDGAFLYATTDLAAIRHRVDDLKADAIVYVTDSRQRHHFEMLFEVARKVGWASENIKLPHVMFGSILGDDGTPLKTRSGENVKLKDLLDEAVERSRSVVEQKNPELDEDEKTRIANAVGIGAVKYADYSNNRTSDYIFSFDKMLALEGNTAPYMQYAYARIKSIERKAQTRDVDIETELAGIKELSLTEPAELDLAKQLLRYGEAIESAAADYRPNYLTVYLYDLAQKFSAFYTNCPVLIAEPDKRPTRLLLCDLTAKTIGHGLDQLLGIEVVEQM